MQSAPLKLGLRSQLESATTKESSLFSFGALTAFRVVLFIAVTAKANVLASTKEGAIQD